MTAKPTLRKQSKGNRMSFSATLAAIQRRFLADYDVSSTIRHKGEKGKQREFGLITLLREHLPLAYGVATGEILAHDGTASPQCDIIVYDQLYYPVLGKNDAVQLVPLEAVYAVIEVRSHLNLNALSDSHAKFAAIKRMPRRPPRSRLKKGMQREPCFVTFGFKLKTNLEALLQHHRKMDTVIVALDTGVGFTLGDKELRHIWMPG